MPKSSSQSRRRPASRWRRNGGNGTDSFSAMDWGAWLEGNGNRATVGTADDPPVLLTGDSTGVGFSDADIPPWPGAVTGTGEEIEIRSGRDASPAEKAFPVSPPDRQSRRQPAEDPPLPAALLERPPPAPTVTPAAAAAPPRITAPPAFPLAARTATPIPTPAAVPTPAAPPVPTPAAPPVPTPAAPPVFPRATPAAPAAVPAPARPTTAAEPTEPAGPSERLPGAGSRGTFPSRRSIRGQAPPVSEPSGRTPSGKTPWGKTSPAAEPRLVPPSHAAPYVPATLLSEDPPELPRRHTGSDLDADLDLPERGRRTGARPHARHSRRGRQDEAGADVPGPPAPWLEEPPYSPESFESRPWESPAPTPESWLVTDPDEGLGPEDSTAWNGPSESADRAAALDPSEGPGATTTTRRGRQRTDPLAPTVLPESPRPHRGRSRLVLPACAGLLALWATTSLIDTPSSLLIAAAALCPAIAVIAVPLAALAVRGRRWITLVVTVLAALLPWALVVGYALPGPGAGPAPGTGSMGLQVMTINAELGRADAAQIVATVHSRRVDILVVTELTGLLAHDLTGAGLGGLLPVTDWVPLGTSAIGGIGVWSRYPIADTTELAGTRWPAARLVLATPVGNLPMIVGHVSPPVPGGGGAWHTDLRIITAAAAGGSRAQLVVGDLNATPWNTPFRRLTRSGMRDAADVLGHGLRNTWPQWLTVPPVALDHVLVAGSMGVRSVDTAVVDGTDHRALIVGLTVPHQTG